MNTESEEIVLPIKFPPPSLVYGHIINPLSIVLGHEGTKGWFYSNYIQLCAPSDYYIYGEEDVEFLNFYPKYYSDFESFYLRTHNLNEKIMRIMPENLVELLISWIDNGYYIETFLNESEIDGTALCVNEIIRLNEQLIFGYDKSKRTFKMTVFNECHQFAVIDVPFDRLKEIFFSKTQKKLCKESEWLSVGEEYGLVLYKFRENVTYKFHIESVISQLEEYLNCSNSAIHFEWLNQEKYNFVFGLDIYNALIAWLNLHTDEYVDNRSLFGLWDHKKIMRERLGFLEEQGYLEPSKQYVEQYKQVEDITNNMRLLIMKYNLLRDKEVLVTIIHLLGVVKEKEANLLEFVLIDLKKQI